ncbi:MAG: hypothetical protein FJX47_07650 [Alphaproteobacteria bacterium]|nr:hypothetical protein [Alphaproteobacteria bacterium]
MPAALVGEDVVAIALADDRLVEALPLLHEIAPALTAESWRAHVAEALSQGKAGLLAVQAGGAMLRGLCLWRVKRALDGTRVLSVFDLVVGRAIYRRATARALFAAIEAQAKGLGCDHVAIDFATADEALAALATEAGYRPDGFRLARKLA